MRNVIKKISAVPKSLIMISAPTHATENPINAMMFFEVWIFSSVAEPTKTNAIFTNSDGWSVTPAISIQFRAPFVVFAMTRFNNSSAIAAIATYKRIFIQKSTLPIINTRQTKIITPAKIIKSCLNAASGLILPIVAIPTPHRKNAITSSSKFRLCIAT